MLIEKYVVILYHSKKYVYRFKDKNIKNSGRIVF